jgi:hypothetical protein
MILNDLFESRMSELDIEYQDYKNLEPVAFYSRYKMTKDEWASKHWSLIKGSETVHEQEVSEEQIEEKQDACYRKVKSRYKVWPSAYASGALVQCRKKGAANWGNKTKK